MDNLAGPISSVVFLALVAAVVYGIVSLARRRRGFAEVDPGIGTVRRLYFYGVSFIALMMAAFGVMEIVRFVLDELFGGAVLSPSRVRLATGLSLTLVGLPLWAVHWRVAQRHSKRLPVETRSVIRKIYAYVVLGVAAGLVIASLYGLIQGVLSTEPFNGWPLAAIAVWTVVWAYHWRLEAAEGQPTVEPMAVRRLYLYLTAAVTLTVGASGLGILIHNILLEAYEGLASLPVLHPSDSGLWRESTKEAVALAIVGGAAWVAHWLYFARRDFESTLRQLYLYLFANTGGAIAVLVALAITLYGALVWTFGVPDQAMAAEHFRFLPGAAASLIVAGVILVYHWLTARQEPKPPGLASEGAHRSYPYALAVLGLGTLGVGIASLVTAALGVLAERGDALAGGDLWRNGVAFGITLCVLGGPLWGTYWASVQRELSVADADGRSRLARRVFLFAVLGVGMLALLVSVSFIIFVFLRELLDGDLGEVLPDTKVAIGISTVTAIFLPYYWLVYRADRRAMPTEEAPAERPERKEVTVLVGEGAAAFLTALETALGYSVSPLHWADPEAAIPELTEEGLQALAGRIGESTGSNVLLVPDGAGVRVLSYR